MVTVLSKSSKKDTQLFEHKYLDKWKGPLATVATAIIPFRQVPRILTGLFVQVLLL